ncbi:hypothetical protein BP6252_05208 [Coleophoma cylindrospora]|uniref:Uncharacterized protein n=1 Tax=Coleophoma cylindrospora TaxID=1849047 RepID=A0A3D8RT31_9HELO|nr:hypothetical protein BP6252_05208 [Coleophoma cylindrospora]
MSAQHGEQLAQQVTPQVQTPPPREAGTPWRTRQTPSQQGMYPLQRGTEGLPPRAEGYREAAIRESRIKDRPYSPMNDNLAIKIELDLEVEVDLYARVKGDVTIGLL